MSLKDPSKFFNNDKEFRDWTFFSVRGTGGKTNGVTIGPEGKVGACTGITFEQMKKMYDAFGDIDLTKCISWSYKLLWEAVDRQVKQNPDAVHSKAGKSGWISHWNKMEWWEGMAHFEPTERDWNQDEIIDEIFGVNGMGAVNELTGRLSNVSDGGGQIATPPLYGTLNSGEQKLVKILESLGGGENYPIALAKLTKDHPSLAKMVRKDKMATLATYGLWTRKAENFPYRTFVFTPIRRHDDEAFGGRPSFDRPRCPKWLDAWCLKYVEKDYYLWWHSSPVAGEQHGWRGAPYRKEAKGEIKDWTPRSYSQRKRNMDPLIQQTFEFHRGWETLDNYTSHGKTGVKDTFATKTSPYKTHYCAYNPFTNNDGDLFSSKELWRGSQDMDNVKFAQWPGGTWNATNAVLQWVEGLRQEGESMLDIAKFTENSKYLKAAWYPGGYQKYDIETVIHTLRHGPGFAGGTLANKIKLKEWVDDIFARQLGMGRNQRDFGSSDGQIPIEDEKVNILQKGNKARENLRWYLLDPVYKVQVNRPWMMWSMRLVLYIIDCVNNGVFKNLPKDAKPFQHKGTKNQYFLKFLINIIWQMFEKFAKIKKAVDNAQKENDKVDAKSSGVAKSKNVAKQIRKNMQCFMLNLIDEFENYHHSFGSKDIKNYEFLRITGPNTNIFNLIGYKPRTINRMLNIQPHQLAMMQPRIKLYKERKARKANSKMFETYTVEVEGPFSTHTNTSTLQTMLQAGGGRSMGAGIKEIVYKAHSGDKDFDTPHTTEVEITFIFNTLQEIFLNFPSFDPKGKVSFPYGVDPKYASLAGSNDKEKLKRIPASYAELVFPINTKNTDFLQVISMSEESANVILEVGWTTPEDIKKLNEQDSKFFKNLNEQSLFKSYVLNPYDSEFNFTNEGQVELIARYYGIERSLEVNPKNKLFPAAGQAQIAGKESLDQNQTLKTHVEKLRKLEQLQNSGKVLTRRQTSDLANFKEIIKREVLYAKANQYDDYVRHQLSDFLSSIFEEDRNIYTCAVPKAFLGARSDGNILKWSPTRDINILRDSPRTIQRGVGSKATTLSKVKGGISKGVQENNANSNQDLLKSKIVALKFRMQLEKKTEEEIKKAVQKLRDEFEKSKKVSKMSSTIKKNATEALKNHGAGFDTSKDIWPIHFVYFGDLVQAVFRESFKSYKFFAGNIGVEDDLGPTEKLNYILGTVLVPIVKGENQVLYSINIADIPLTLSHFSNYIVEKLVSPQAYKMTRYNFIQGLLKSILRDYFNSDCFVGQVDIQRTTPQTVLFSMPSFSKKDKKGDGTGGIWKLSGFKGKKRDLGMSYTKNTFKARMQQFEANIKANSKDISKRPHYKYVFLGSRGLTRQSYDRKSDLQDNIHHFYFGAGKGLVKNVSFKSEELPHQTEALLLEGISAVNPQATAFIPRLFNCSLTMIGNSLFDPGHTFFVDPTMGTMIGQTGRKKDNAGINVIKDTGLGGYFYVASVETRIGPGVYETVLEGIKTGVAKKGDNKRPFYPAPTEEIKDKGVPYTSPENARDKKLGAGKGKKPKPTPEQAAAAAAQQAMQGISGIGKVTSAWTELF
tara:strand:- start:2326 stop:7041 length:4716 start_codon:yes stop_codon:yes gene_type:complete